MAIGLSLILMAGELLLIGTAPVAVTVEQYIGYAVFLLTAVLISSAGAFFIARFFGAESRREARKRDRELAELMDKVDGLEGQAERREEFIASFAHELKTPLTAIIGYADMLRSMNLPPKQQFTAAGYIFSEGKRLESLSLKLLDLIVAGKYEVALRRTEAFFFLREVAAVALPSIKEDGLELNIFGDRGEVLLEPDLFKTLLINLVDNARKASRRGKKIDLSVKRQPGGMVFCVRDYGYGIPAEELDKITEAFYMVDKSRSRSQNGAGIGLALCQRIAEIHETVLAYESEPGKGTVVRVFIKTAEAAR